MIEQLFAKKCY